MSSHHAKSILISGGSGFVGSRLIKHFVNLGYRDISVLSRNALNAQKTVKKVLLVPDNLISCLPEKDYLRETQCELKFIDELEGNLSKQTVQSTLLRENGNIKEVSRHCPQINQRLPTSVDDNE